MNRATRRKILRDVRAKSKSLAQKHQPYSDQVGERRKIAKELSRVSDRA